MHVGIAGNIGAGKTTLTRLLAKSFGWEPHYEEADTNPYLISFYEDMERWSFNLQVYFLNTRFRQIMDIREKKKNRHSRQNDIRRCLYICRKLA